MKETSPRERFGFYQLIDEVVLCLSSQVLKEFCSLIEGVKVQKRVSEEKSGRFTSFREYCLILPSALLPQAELAVPHPMCTSYPIESKWGLQGT